MTNRTMWVKIEEVDFDLNTPTMVVAEIGALRPVWQTSLVNPDFAEFARLCGGRGWKVDDPGDLRNVLAQALAVTDGPSLVEVTTAALAT